MWKVHCATALKESLKAARQYGQNRLSGSAHRVVYIYIHIKMHSASERAFCTASTPLPPPFCAAWQKVFNKRNSSWFVKQLCKTWTVKPQLTALMWNSWEGGESLAGWDRTQQWCPYSVEGLLSHTTCSPYSFKGKPVTTVWTDGCLASIPWTHGTRRSKGS